jgi:chromosome condensin MukBEF ATPase and DNA-binding subunit MukB
MERKSVGLNNSSFNGNLVQGNVGGNVEYKPVSESKSMSETTNYDLREAKIGAIAKDNARQQINQHFYESEQKQTLAEAAKEIQELLKQLEKTNPNATEAEKIAHVNDETTPNFKRRAVGALQAGGEAAIEEFLDNSYINVGKAIVKGWMKPE